MRQTDRSAGSHRAYKRGAVMGLTVAEAFILLSFVLLLLFTWWQVDTERRSLNLTENLQHLTETQKAAIITGLTDGTFDMAQKLRDVGVTLQDVTPIADTERFSRFMREEDLQRLMNGAVELDPGTLLKLSEVAEIRPETQLKASLETLLTPQDTAATQASARLAEAAEREDRMRRDLERELGARIRAAGGQLTQDGTVILPEKILFSANSAVVRNPEVLEQLCAAWVGTLQSSDVDISELKIEGHASSEGRAGEGPEAAYLYNLDLSQRRAQNALKICINGLTDPDVINWARGRLSSAGYSSARLVRNAQGNEDREASRRVMFSMELNREKLLEDIREDLMREPAKPVISLGDPTKILSPLSVSDPGHTENPSR